MKLLKRRALLGLIAGACALAFPAIASASATPSLVLTPGNTTTAGATGATLGYDLSFAYSGADSAVTAFTTSFPAGLLADSTLDNDQCLATVNDIPACQIASGTATLTPGGSGIPAAEYLEPAPNPAADVAGVALYIGGGKVGNTADVTVRPNDAGLDIAFTGLPSAPQLNDLDLTLSDLRLPSSCSSGTMTVTAVGNSSGTQPPVNSNSFTPTGCPSQAYSPSVAAQVTAFGQPGSADVAATITQAAGQAASKQIVLDLPSSIQPNLAADAGCLLGSPCQIGTASALTPLAPPQALANGTVTLGLGATGAPTITIAFPAPYALSFQGVINTTNNTVTVQNIPDVPLSSLALNITNTPAGTAFTSDCQASDVGAQFSGQGGQSSNVSVPITFVDCSSSTTPQSPSASSSLDGLKTGHPVLHLHVVHGTNAANLSRVAIALGHGLKFSSKGLVKRCTGHGIHRKCKIVGKGLTLSGAKLKKIRLSGGRLVLTFKHAVGQVSLTIRGPLLAETKNLKKKVKHHKVKKLAVIVTTTDASGTRTAIGLHPKA